MKDETWDQWKQRVGWQDINHIVYRLECQIRDLDEEAEDILCEIEINEDDSVLVKLHDEYEMIIDDKRRAVKQLLEWFFRWDDDRQYAVESDET